MMKLMNGKAVQRSFVVLEYKKVIDQICSIKCQYDEKFLPGGHLSGEKIKSGFKNDPHFLMVQDLDFHTQGNKGLRQVSKKLLGVKQNLKSYVKFKRILLKIQIKQNIRIGADSKYKGSRG